MIVLKLSWGVLDEQPSRTLTGMYQNYSYPILELTHQKNQLWKYQLVMCEELRVPVLRCREKGKAVHPRPAVGSDSILDVKTSLQPRWSKLHRGANLSDTP